jgi:hypothetical protein
LRLLLYHLGRPIKGYWDTKTTRCTTTWLVARPETGLIISQLTWTRPSRITGHPWACTSSEIARRGCRETLFYKNLLRLTRRRYLVRNLLRPQGHREELIKALPRELVKAPLRGPIWYPVHLGDLEEGLNRRGARNLEDSDQTAQRGGNTGKALGSGNTGQLRRPHGVQLIVDR